MGQKIELPVGLQIGQLTDAVTVTGEAPLLRTVNAEIAEVIDNRQVEQLPLNGRQFVQLAQLTDGVTVSPGGTRGSALGQAGPLPNVYGQRGGHNIYLVDGVKVTDELYNNLVISPSVDAIQEFKISKTMYPAEFGGKASALINVVTKSGGNNFHGSVLGFVRNEKFDARNYFDDPDQADAATPAEPVRRQRRRSARVAIGPSSSSVTKGSGSARRRPRPSRCRRRRFATAIFRPCPSRSAIRLTRTAAGCTPFAGNQIPAGRLSSVAKALMAKVPLPTSAGLVQNLLGVEDQVNPTNQFSLRVDHRLGVERQPVRPGQHLPCA